MSISFACDFCSRKYRVDDGLAGRKVKCKECGTDLTIPGSGAVAAAAKPPVKDLYGLDDEVDAPLPPPRRPGFQAEPSTPGRKRTKSASPGWHNEPIRRLGNTLLVLGGLSFVLPFIGLQVKGLHLMSDQMQIGAGIVMVAIGAILRVTSAGFLKALGLMLAGGVVGLVALAVLGGMLLNKNRGGPGNANGMVPHFAVGGQAVPGLHVVLSNGRVTPTVSPIGTPMPGLNFQADYRFDHRLQGTFRYRIVIKGANKGATDEHPHLLDSGSLGESCMTLNQADGPFEMYVEVQTFGGAGWHRASRPISMAWADAPPARDPFQQPNFPPQPGFTPPNFPPHPGFAPPNPGAMPGPPQFPRRRLPQFGPRGG